MNLAKKTVFFIALAAVALTALYVSMPVHAITLDDQIAAIRAQIAALQNQLQQLLGLQNNPQPVWCHTFNTNLRIGESGPEIAALQTALSKEGLFTQTASNGFATFDEPLASATVAFQEKFASEILAPSNLTHGTGFVGNATRAKLNALFGCNGNITNTGDDLLINSVSGPTSLAVNQTGTWTINASDPDDARLNYWVNWGDRMPLMPGLMTPFSQTASFTHSYFTAGTYTITFRVSDTEGNVATQTATVTVGSQGNLAPTANSQSISTNQNTQAQITLTGSDPQNLPLTFMVVSNPAHGSLTGTAPNLTYTPNANFTGNDSFTFKVNNGSQDSNIATVSIMVNGSGNSNRTPVITSVSGPVSLAINQTGTWTIRASDVDSNTLTYSVMWGDEGQMRAMMASPIISSGQTATFTHSYAAAGTYTVVFHVMDSSGNTATSTLTVSVFGSSSGQNQQNSVSVMDSFFSPRTIIISAGTTVTWTNMGSMNHTVTADNASFDSGALPPGSTFSRTFNTPGTFNYYCRFHGGPGGVGMSGVVIVQ